MSYIHYPSLTPPEARSRRYLGRITLKIYTQGIPFPPSALGRLRDMTETSCYKCDATLVDGRATLDVYFEAGDGFDREDDERDAVQILETMENAAIDTLAGCLGVSVDDVEIGTTAELQGIA